MRPPLELRTARGYWKRIIGLWVGTGLFASLAIAQSVHTLMRPSAQKEMAIYMLLVAAFLLLAPGVLLIARRRWVVRFDERGVTLRNGRTFSWTRFEKLEPRRSHKNRFINNYDLVFSDGTAGVYHHMVENYHELRVVIAALERGENPFTS
jgi:hypothetical protein